MIARPSRGFRHHAVEAESLQIEFVDKSLDDADWVVIGDIVFQAIGKQRCLAAILAFDETFHSSPRKSFAKAYMIQAFSHSLDPSQPLGTGGPSFSFRPLANEKERLTLRATRVLKS